jgi:hypothetical protein
VSQGATPSTGTTLRVRLRVLSSGSEAHDQFYLPEISSCWQLDGSPCEAGPSAISTAVTRYTCFIVAPSVSPACSAKNQGPCPPYHVSLNGTRIYRNDTARFPYECYYQHCPPSINGSAGCDSYSNPNPQELQQLLPCAEWEPHGFPASAADVWIGQVRGTDGITRGRHRISGGLSNTRSALPPCLICQDRLWELDVGALQARLYYSGEEPPVSQHDALRARLGLPHVDTAALPPYPGWTRPIVSLEVGPEQMAGDPLLTQTVVRWETLDWDVLVG